MPPESSKNPYMTFNPINITKDPEYGKQIFGFPDQLLLVKQTSPESATKKRLSLVVQNLKVELDEILHSTFKEDKQTKLNQIVNVYQLNYT
jgi:hypothetical protein